MQSLQIVARVLDDYDKKVSLFLSLSSAFCKQAILHLMIKATVNLWG